jgi:bacillithiol biosynthesis cysteine-adding enzyme BshC
MVSYSYNFSELPGFSKLFIDFINGEPFFNSRFPANAGLFSNDGFFEKQMNFKRDREQLIETIKDSMNCVKMSDVQVSNLNYLLNENALAVVTGQQVGFLGGPLYTVLKTFTTINLSEKLNSHYKEQYKFVPVFWLEDNDHDNLEASQAAIFDTEYKIEHLFCMEGVSKADRTCVSEREFDKTINKELGKLASILPVTKYKDDLISKLKGIYKPGISWGNGFITLLNSWFCNKGLLFIKASEVRKKGLFSKLANKELESVGMSESIINKANTLLETNGYHIQAKSFEVNLFLHDKNERHKIKKVSPDEDKFDCNGKIYIADELKKLAEKEPQLFSPNVLLRPVFQDYVLPTAAYIGGPSEIGYTAQIKELYEYFTVPMPAFLPRHSASFLDNHTARFLEKQELEPNYFTKKFSEIESDLNNILFDKNIEKLFDKTRKLIRNNYEEIKNESAKIDPTLIRTGAAACHKSLEQLDSLEKKIQTAQKRVHDIVYSQYRQAANFFYPEGTMQERLYSAINFMNLIGEDNFLALIDELVKTEADKHYYVKLD